MAKKKAKKLGLFGLIFLLASVVGLILAVVGICIDFFVSSGTALGETVSEGSGLFEDYSLLEATMDGNLTIVIVQVFAIVSLVLTALACLITVCGSLGIVRVGGLAKFIGAALVIVLAVFVIVFAATYAGQVPTIDGGNLLGTKFAPAAGAYLVMVGGVVSGASMLLAKLK